MRADRALLFAALVLASCDLPRDPGETENRVRAGGVIRLGVIEGAAIDPAAERALARLAAETGAQVRRRAGTGETLLPDLRNGRLDLVYGRFADDSPWRTHVHFGAPLGGGNDAQASRQRPRFAFRAGENGWIAEVGKVGG